MDMVMARIRGETVDITPGASTIGFSVFDNVYERPLHMGKHQQRRKTVPLMSVPEVAKYLGIGRKAVYDLIDWGELGAIRENGVIRVDGNSVRAFQESGKRP